MGNTQIERSDWSENSVYFSYKFLIDTCNFFIHVDTCKFFFALGTSLYLYTMLVGFYVIQKTSCLCLRSTLASLGSVSYRGWGTRDFPPL